MTDSLTPQQRSYCMSQVKGKNTELELRLRKAVWRAGLRYRLASKNVVGKPDFVFPSAKVAVFVDGCFWHACPQHLQQPQANYGFWDAKLKKNIARDETVNRQLEEAGWRVLRFWEHELDYSVDGCVARIKAALDSRKRTR